MSPASATRGPCGPCLSGPAYRWRTPSRANNSLKESSMEVGLHFVNFDVPGGVQALPTTLAATAQAAEQAGAVWFTMADHFFQMDNLWPAGSPMLEVYTCLGYLAGQTE